METREAAALASEPDPDERIVSEDSEVRERREVRGRTGFRDYLVAACGGAPVDRCGCRVQRSVWSGGRRPRSARAVRRHRRASCARCARRKSIARSRRGRRSTHPPCRPSRILFEHGRDLDSGAGVPDRGIGIAADPEHHHGAPVERGSGGRRGAVNGGRLRAREPFSPKRLTGQIEFSVEDLAVHPALESDLVDVPARDRCRTRSTSKASTGRAVRTLNGLFQSGDERQRDRNDRQLCRTGWKRSRRWSMGGMRATWGTSAASSVPRRLACRLHGAVSRRKRRHDAVREAARAHGVASRFRTACRPWRAAHRRAMITRNAGGQPIRVYTWGSLQLIRDPYSGAGGGKVTVTAVQLVSDPFIPYGVESGSRSQPRPVVVGAGQWPRSRSSPGQRSAAKVRVCVLPRSQPANRRASSG